MDFNSYTDFTIPLPNDALEWDRANLLHFSDMIKGKIIFHSHVFYEFILITEGQISISIEGNQFSLSKGALISIPFGMTHSTSVLSEDRRYSRTILHVFPEYLWSTLEKEGMERGQFDFLKKPFVINQEAVRVWGFETMLEKVDFAMSLEEPYREAMTASLLREMLILFRHIVTKQRAVILPMANKTVTLAIRYISRHYREPALEIEEVAEAVHVSKGHLSRIFKTYTGISVYTYIMRLRLEDARMMLFTGNGIMDVCMKCGFSEYTSFLKAFKKVYGTTPKEFRDTARKQLADYSTNCYVES